MNITYTAAICSIQAIFHVSFNVLLCKKTDKVKAMHVYEVQTSVPAVGVRKMHGEILSQYTKKRGDHRYKNNMDKPM